MTQDFAVLDAVHQNQATNFDDIDRNMAFRSDGQKVAQMGDDKLYVNFYTRSVRNEAKSLEAGRAIFEEQTYINIKLPGDKHNDVNRVAYPEDIMRFPIHYERFRKNMEQVVGTPLTAVPFLTDPQVQEYKALYIRTVEQLAGLPDVQCQKIFGSVAHKQQAVAWLESFKGADRLRQEFETEKAETAKMIASLNEQLAKLQGAKK